tara:strand:- start:1074 stop:1862 length:789 start_codon:yes stop_codon:yes gene_type:complete
MDTKGLVVNNNNSLFQSFENTQDNYTVQEKDDEEDDNDLKNELDEENDDDDNEDDNDDDIEDDIEEEDDDDDDDDLKDEDSVNSEIIKENTKEKNDKKKVSKSNQVTNLPDTQINLPSNIEINNDDYLSDEDEEEDDDYLQKFDQEMRENYIVNYHPETLNQNYDEIYNLSKVKRNNENIIIDDLHKTIPILTKYEKTRILGLRAKQLNNGSKPFVSVSNKIMDGYLIALKELEEKKIPFIIKRPLPNGCFEFWQLKDLEVI